MGELDMEIADKQIDGATGEMDRIGKAIDKTEEKRHAP
jgi:hypothetical protein